MIEMAKPPLSKAEKPAPDTAPALKPARTRVRAWFAAVVLLAAVVGLLIWANSAGLFRPPADPAAIALEARITHIVQSLSAVEAKLDAATDVRRDRDEVAAARPHLCSSTCKEKVNN